MVTSHYVLLGIDYGEKTIGSAFCFSNINKVFEYKRISGCKNFTGKVTAIGLMIQELECSLAVQVRIIVIGIPDDYMGSNSLQHHVTAFIQVLQTYLSIHHPHTEVQMISEYGSTEEAYESLRIEQNISRKRAQRYKDTKAAAIILSRFVNSLI